jgi:hypothetical protein
MSQHSDDILERLRLLKEIEAINRPKAKYFLALDPKLCDVRDSVFTEDVEATASSRFEDTRSIPRPWETPHG